LSLSIKIIHQKTFTMTMNSKLTGQKNGYAKGHVDDDQNYE
jgi:hypothetical protein